MESPLKETRLLLIAFRARINQCCGPPHHFICANDHRSRELWLSRRVIQGHIRYSNFIFLSWVFVTNGSFFGLSNTNMIWLAQQMKTRYFFVLYGNLNNVNSYLDMMNWESMKVIGHLNKIQRIENASEWGQLRTHLVIWCYCRTWHPD